MMGGSGAFAPFDEAELPPSPPELSGHIAICNFNDRLGPIVDGLHRVTAPTPVDIVLLLQDLALWQDRPDWRPQRCDKGHFFVIPGCPSERPCLHRAQITRARAAIILADPAQGDLADARSTLVAIAIEAMNQDVHTVMELIASVNREHLRATDINEVICLGELTEKLIAQSCISPGVTRVFDRLLSLHDRSSQIHLPPVPPTLIGCTYRDLARRAIERDLPFVVCGFLRTLGTPTVVVNPRPGVEPGRDSVLAEGDSLVVLSRQAPMVQDLV